MAQSLSVGPIHHIRMTVTDVERSREFYTSVLGFQVIGGYSNFEKKVALT